MALQNQKMTPVYFFKVLLLATISILALNFCLTKMPNPAKERFETMINEAIRLVESGEKDSVRFHAVSSLFPDKYLIVYRNKDGKVVTEWTNN